ncbi:MAG: hypothetical protein U1E05_23300 [Patescibacteria group bacterium]|nr:hypothetical protein [Patescibacteria group bacterium]
MSDDSFNLLGRTVDAIRRMGEDDLRYLNRLIVDRLKLITQARSTAMLAEFSVGDRVSFANHSGDRKTGTIVRLNRKTASITTDDGQQWKVHPSYLTSAAAELVESPRGRYG